ncbi:helicase [Streptomyces virginiae]|uniref:Helicase n=1 Tax=Streptomyces virginiae TaxID=1961 RepID=A0ABQ3NL48_STRVG|nr:DEAD/DEAH box helicase [Streptomyces virginiae]MBP2342606.1 superfamily II DNA or RNA helicase [Streptomyces virginiae]GGQ20173.1 helicase [Streptomyces virginiae]GHI13506.1 helicase [Streptomyces virginiae]
MRAEISDLIRCSAVFLPGDPARSGRIALWQADGTPPGTPGTPSAPAAQAPGAAVGSDAFTELTVVTSDLRRTTVRALVLTVDEALPLLTRARAGAETGTGTGTGKGPGADGAGADGAAAGTVFWGAAALLALRFAARGKLLPGLSPAGHDAWRIGPLEAADLDEVRALAAAMPPGARCLPLNPEGPPRLPAAEPLLRAFLDAVADTLPRSPAAPAAAGGPAFAARPPERRPHLRDWTAEVAAGHDAGVRLSLRIELTPEPGRTPASPEAAEAATAAGGFRAVLQMHSPADAALVADAADVWAGSGAAAAAFPPGARLDALRALRRAARLWPPLAPLLGAAVPDAVELADEEVTELLGEAAAALAADGVQVHWPRALVRGLTARAVVGSPGPHASRRPHSSQDAHDSHDTAGSALPPGLLSPGALLSFSWRHALGGHGDLTPAELDRLAEANRPLVRLRDQWVLIDPAEARRARALQDRTLPAADALAAVLTGSAEIDGERVGVEAAGALERLRARLTGDPHEADEVDAPPGLSATLRDYQLHGLRWLARMTSLGLGACLADDMGLGKTVTLIALHLHRNGPGASTAGPTLVVCPASLLGNWEREIGKFAPGTPVRRFHGPGRSLAGLTPGAGEFVLTTYGTMRLDAAALAATDWGLVVADEAQHVKNPRSSTAKALRTVPARARVALTGTPVENDLSELWAVLDWTTPGILGRPGTFRARYAEPVESGRDPQAAARLSALVRPFLLRRRKSDPGIAPELPPKTETDHPVSLTGEQTALYEAVVRETLVAISEADGMERRGLVVKLLTSLKQICNHPAHYLGDGGATGGSRSGKLELLDELLDTIVAEGGSVLVFTQYVTMARLIERHLAARGIGTQLLHGGTPVARREELVDAFQAGEVPVFLLSLKAAGTGLNLTRAGHVVHFDRWWNPAVEEQATDRAYRIGQTQPVQVHRIIAEGTVEDRIARLLERKRALADAVLAGGESALTELTDAELAELVALRPAAGSTR